MNTKKLIVFLLWAFLPMVIVGGVKIKGTGPVSRITPPAEASTRGVLLLEWAVAHVSEKFVYISASMIVDSRRGRRRKLEKR